MQLQGNNVSKKVAIYGMLIAVTIAVSYVEMLVPTFVPIPGVKIGLSNIVILFTLYRMNTVDAVIVNLLRIILVGVLFGNIFGIVYSLGGAILSFVVMYLLKRTEKFSVITVSILGGIMHNVGQILVAMVVLQTSSLVYYLIVLWGTGIVSGFLVGILGGMLIKKIPQKITLNKG